MYVPSHAYGDGWGSRACASGHHGGWAKHTLMSADTHVPLLIRAPGYPPKRVHAPVELVDLYPTLLTLAAVRGPPPSTEQPALQGRSLVPLMRHRSPRSYVADSAAFSQWRVSKPIRCMGYAVRTQGWLLIQWAADTHVRAGGDKGEEGACEAHADLLRVRRNASQLRETLVSASRPGSLQMGHPFVVDRLRRRLRKALRVQLRA